VEETTNVLIQFAGVQIYLGDIAFDDRSGVVIILNEGLEEVISKIEYFIKKSIC